MADVSDIYSALTALLLGVFYPGGTPSPGQLSTVTDTVVRIYPGWPQADQMNQDLQNGVVTVSVFAKPGMYKNTTRYPLDFQTLTPPAPTLTATVTNNQVTFGGTVSVPQNVAILSGITAWTYEVQSGDTLSSIATNVAALIPGATASGPTVTMPSPINLKARVGATGVSIKEVMRTERHFLITYWCPTPELRDLASAPAIAAIAQQNFLSLDDGTGARIITVGDDIIDDLQKPLIYRRNTVYYIEYGTTITETDTQIVTAAVQSETGSSISVNANF